MFNRLALAAAVAVVGLLAPAAMAGSSNPRYQLRRQGMGPRPDQVVWVRVERDAGGDRTSARTGDDNRPPKRRVVQRWAGRRYIGPVTVFE